MLTAFLLSASIFTPIFGRVGDMVGKERMLVVTMLALAAGTVLAGLAQSIGVLIVAGPSKASGVRSCPSRSGSSVTSSRRAKVATGVGIVAAMAAVGGGAGIVLAGPIVSHLNYHWLFWFPLAISLSPRSWPTSSFPSHRCAPRAGSTGRGPCCCPDGWWRCSSASAKPPRGDGDRPKVIGLIALAVVIGVAWVFVEYRSKEPLIDMRMMRIPAVWTNNLVAFLIGIGMYSVIGFLPEFLQTPKSTGYGFGASIIQSGLYLLPLTVTMFITGMLSGRIAAAIGSKAAVIIGAIFSLPGTSCWPSPTPIRGRSTRPARCSASASDWPSPPCRTCRPGRTGRADRRGQRDERQHPNHRWCHRRGRDVQHRDLGTAAQRIPGRVRLYPGIRLSGRHDGGGDRGRHLHPHVTKVPAGEDRDHHHHLEHAELALIPAGTITE